MKKKFDQYKQSNYEMCSNSESSYLSELYPTSDFPTKCWTEPVLVQNDKEEEEDRVSIELSTLLRYFATTSIINQAQKTPDHPN